MRFAAARLLAASASASSARCCGGTRLARTWCRQTELAYFAGLKGRHLFYSSSRSYRSSSYNNREDAAVVSFEEQRELTFQKVSKLIGDKKKAEVRLSPRDKDFLSELLEKDTGKLNNFWLNAVVLRPSLLELPSPSVLLAWERMLVLELEAPRKEATSLLCIAPKSLLSRPADAKGRLLEWRSFCLGKGYRSWCGVLARAPQVLMQPASAWAEREETLAESFGARRMKTLLDCSPGVMVEDEDVLKEKVLTTSNENVWKALKNYLLLLFIETI